MRALVIGDPHFKINNSLDTEEFAAAVVKVAAAILPDIIVVLGDVLDRHESMHVNPHSRAIKFLAQLMEISPTYVLMGNHDLKNNRQFLSQEHGFTALRYWGPRMILVDTVIKTTIGGQVYTFVPFVEIGRFTEALNTVKGWEASTCIFCHQEFQGVRMRDIVSTEGDEWSPENPFVVSGHIHGHQLLGENISYTGTGHQINWGDSADKSISLFTFWSAQERKEERIYLGLRSKITVDLKVSEADTVKLPENADLRIIVSGLSGETKAFKKHPNYNLWKRAGFKVILKTIVERNNVPFGPMFTPRVRFSKSLYNRLESPSLKNIYHKLFGLPQDN